MSNLTVHECEGVLVVDSRLVAQELGVNHGDWFRNVVIKYRQEIEADFGVFRFENGKSVKGSRGGRPEQFALLTEEQATILMTYSRNTEQVRCCKRRLVKAFTKAKKLLEQTKSTQTHNESNIPSLPSARERLETIRLGLDLFNELGGCDERTQVQLKDQIRNILLADKLQPSPTASDRSIPANLHGRELPPRLEYPVSDRAIELNYRPTNSQLQQIGKKAKKLYLERHGTEPIKREQFVGGATRMVNVYGFGDLDLLDEAIYWVMDKK